MLHSVAAFISFLHHGHPPNEESSSNNHLDFAMANTCVPETALLPSIEQGNSGWDMQPIRKPVTAAWDVQVSKIDAKKIESGFVPENMEDKWLCYSSRRDADGVTLVHFCRSWSKTEQMVLTLQPAADGAEGMQEAGARIITEIMWEAQDADSDLGQDEAKENAIMICNGILGCALEEKFD